jgi:hypothetical protein
LGTFIAHEGFIQDIRLGEKNFFWVIAHEGFIQDIRLGEKNFFWALHLARGKLFHPCTFTTPIPKFFQTSMRQSILYNNCKRKFEVQTVEQNIFDNCKTQKKILDRSPPGKKKFIGALGCAS